MTDCTACLLLKAMEEQDEIKNTIIMRRDDQIRLHEHEIAFLQQQVRFLLNMAAIAVEFNQVVIETDNKNVALQTM